MNSNWNQYYDVIKNVSSLAGQWPYQRFKMRLFCLSVLTLSTLSLMVPQIAKFVTCNSNLQCILQTLSSYMLTSISLVKLYTCFLNRFQMKILVDQLFGDWDELESAEEYKIMKKYAETGRRYSLGYSLYCYISVYVFMSVSLIPQLLDVVLPLNESRPVLSTYPGYFFIDERKYFYYIYSFSIIAVTFSLTGLIVHDCLLLTYIEHVCSIFTIIGFRFEQLMSAYKCTDVVKIFPKTSDTHKRIAFSVKTHQKALKFAQLLEDTFSLSLAVQIMLNTVMISFTLLQITQQNGDILEQIRFVFYVVALLIHLFCLSFEGQKLIDHSLQLHEKIYNGIWYEVPTKSQKMLLFIMHKNIQPVFLSAGKGIFIFSLENFTTIVQTSMSYFTVLSSLD